MFKRLIIFTLLCLLALGIVGCGGTSDTSSDTTTNLDTATPVPSTTATNVASPTTTPLHVSSVSIVTNPNTLSKVSCNSTTNITFTATITVNGGSSGGNVAYTWSANGSNTSGQVLFAPNETSKAVQYTLNNLPIQYNATNTTVTFTVNSPNALTVPAKPVSNCTFTGPFVVQGIGLGASPASIAGLPCGTTINVTYTATITVAPESNGGTVSLTWAFALTTRTASVVFAPNTTTQSVSYTLSGKLSRNAFPRAVLIYSTSPNTVYSNYAVPAGTCV